MNSAENERKIEDGFDVLDVFKQCDVYVLCSTLNQIVNYIPYKMIKKVKETNFKTCNITMIKEKRQFDNSQWDKNLKEVLGNNFDYEIKLERKFDVNAYGNDILSNIDEVKYKNKVIIWNITGGQRTTLTAIYEFLKRDDVNSENYILYLEGNTNKMFCAYTGGKNQYTMSKIQTYEDDTLNIETVFKLAGFKAKVNGANYVKGFKEILNTSKAKYLDFYTELYNKYFYDKDLRCDLLRLNEDINLCDELYERIVAKLTADKSLVLNEIKQKNAFGYILEYLTIAKLSEATKEEEFFLELAHDVDVRRIIGPENVYDKYSLCQLDAVLLTKSGQLIIFECKSGYADSASLKGRNYTVYALAGVYGMPVLIQPYIDDEYHEELSTKRDKILDKLMSTKNSAIRAGMEVWELNKIPKELRTLCDMKDYLGGTDDVR